MADRSPLTTATLDTWSREVLAASVVPRDRDQVVELVNALLNEMQSMRQFAVNDREPVLIYDPAAES